MFIASWSGLILANGMPKSGTHALMRCLHLLGLERTPGLLKGIEQLRWKRTSGDPEGIGTLKQLLGMSNKFYIHTHAASKFELTLRPTKHIFITRDPRNVVVSFYRSGSERPTLKEIIATKYCYGIGIEKAVSKFSGWMDNNNCLVIKYEDLITRELWPEVIGKISAFIDMPTKDASFDDLFPPYDSIYSGKKMDTWSGAISRWQDYWDDEIRTVWRMNDGPKLLELMGYEE